jgi:hypothetical protein
MSARKPSRTTAKPSSPRTLRQHERAERPLELRHHRVDGREAKIDRVRLLVEQELATEQRAHVRPARQDDAAAGTADARQLGRRELLARREHHTEGR